MSEAPSKTSSVTLRSNFYPVEAATPYQDDAFIGAIHDPFLLDIFHRRFEGNHRLSPLQNDERQYAIHCIYAEKDDFPWGTIKEGDTEKVVCRCENYGCELFSECRPGVDRRDEAEASAPEADASPIKQPVATADIDAINEAFYAGIEPAGKTEPTYAPDAGGPETVSNEREETHLWEQQNLGFEDEDDFDFYLDDLFSTEDSEELDEEQGTEELPQEEEEHTDDAQAAPGSPTEEQLKVIELPSDARAVVNAGPGTGKTFTLIEKIKYMLEEQHVPADEILVLSFSRAAIDVIESRLQAASESGELNVAWQALDIRTFDKFATWILYQGARLAPSSVPDPFLPDEASIPKMDYERRILEARNLISNWDGLFSNVSHVFVDETQDLVSPRADLVLAILESLPDNCGFTLLGDSCQAIYEYSAKGKRKGSTRLGTTSKKMLESVATAYSPQMFTLSVNQRQKGELPYSLETLRSLILEEDKDGAREEIGNIIEAFGGEAEDIRSIDGAVFESAAGNGTLGILTRTNGEALTISNLLRDKSVPHRLKITGREDLVSRIVADVFVGYEQDTISRGEFVARAIAHGGGSEEECTEAWYELADECRSGAMGSRYLVEDLLQCVASQVKRSPFFTSSSDGRITVSTIHSAKGREYDTVWLASEDLSKAAKNGDIEECRVAYVALSRPIKGLELKTFSTSSQIKSVPNKSNQEKRFFRVPLSAMSNSPRRKKRKISNIEPVNGTDVFLPSFGENEGIQRTIAETCVPGNPLSLVRRPSDSSSFPEYVICLETDEGQRPIGMLGPSFAKSYAAILAAMNGGVKAGHVPEEYIDDCPEAFDNLYIEDIITCIGSATTAPLAATRFGNQAVWYGVSLTGLAKANARSY